MAIKLGELLLNEKLITPEQLDEALKSQVLFGIKLGSSLIELGYISDEQLCLFLSNKLGVPAVTGRDMSSVPSDVLALVPAELAGKFRVVPIKVEGKKLSLAMADPTDFKATDDVAFVTGYIILPHIAPDVRISSALSKYYHVRGDIRYLKIEGELANKRRKTPATGSTKKVEKIEIPVLNDSGELVNVEIPLEFEGFASLHGYDENPDPSIGGVERYTVDRLSIEFASAKNRDQIANGFINYLGQEFTLSALFIIRNNMAVGWRGVTAGSCVKGLENTSIHLGRPSVIRDVLETSRFFMGTLDKTPENSQLLKTLGGDFDTALLVLPISVQEKIIAVVVVSVEMEAFDTRLLELQKLVTKASLAFEMLIIKNKILMT